MGGECKMKGATRETVAALFMDSHGGRTLTRPPPCRTPPAAPGTFIRSARVEKSYFSNTIFVLPVKLSACIRAKYTPEATDRPLSSRPFHVTVCQPGPWSLFTSVFTS